MVYGAALERRFAGNCIEGSNPSPSAKQKNSEDSEFFCFEVTVYVVIG